MSFAPSSCGGRHGRVDPVRKEGLMAPIIDHVGPSKVAETVTSAIVRWKEEITQHGHGCPAYLIGALGWCRLAIHCVPQRLMLYDLRAVGEPVAVFIVDVNSELGPAAHRLVFHEILSAVLFLAQGKDEEATFAANRVMDGLRSIGMKA